MINMTDNSLFLMKIEDHYNLLTTNVLYWQYN